MIVLYLLGWMLLGFVVIFTTIFIHVLMAEKRGYRALKWLSCASKKANFNTDHTVIKLIFGLLIWPIRLTQFLMKLPNYYSKYERY